MDALNIFKPILKDDGTMTPSTTAHFLAITGISYTNEQLEELFNKEKYNKKDKEEFFKIYNSIKEMNFKIPDLPRNTSK